MGSHDLRSNGKLHILTPLTMLPWVEYAKALAATSAHMATTTGQTLTTFCAMMSIAPTRTSTLAVPNLGQLSKIFYMLASWVGGSFFV